MKHYTVTVNGTAYDVTVEAAEGYGAAVVPKAASVPAQKSAPKAAASGEPVTAPLTGVLLDIKVKVGEVVAQNAVVAVIEAMKMENDIVTPFAGKVSAIAANKGNVNAGDILLLIERTSE